MGILSGGRIYGYGRGLNFRKSQGERLRFKVLHKIQDYKSGLEHRCALDAAAVNRFARNTYLTLPA